MSTLTHLEGSESGRTYPADELMNLDPADDRPLLARYDLERAAATLTKEALRDRRTGGLWRWAEILPATTFVLTAPFVGNAEAVAVANLDHHIEGRRRLALQHALLGPPPARLLVTQGHALDPADEVGQDRRRTGQCVGPELEQVDPDLKPVELRRRIYRGRREQRAGFERFDSNAVGRHSSSP